MNFYDWFENYHKSYDLRCGMTKLHMKTAWEIGRKELIDFVDLILKDYNRTGIWSFSGEALKKLQNIKRVSGGDSRGHRWANS